MTGPVTETPAEVRARKGRNLAIALTLAAFVVIVFVVTIVRLGANVINANHL